nr:replication endonuclease [uncultured Vibrio sp.]
MDTKAVELKMAAKTFANDAIHQNTFTRRFFPRLPAIVRNDVRRKVEARTQRKNATRENVIKTASDAVKLGLKCAAHIENRYSFVDSRKGAKSEALTHNILMRDDALTKLAEKYADKCADILSALNAEGYDTFVSALTAVYTQQKDLLESIHIKPPYVNFRSGDDEVLEQMLTVAVLKMQSEKWVERRLLRLRSDYIEYAQISLSRVGDKGHQSKYVSEVSFANWKRKQRESEQFMQSMSVYNDETGEHFPLAEVAKRTIANPENRRIEMMVRSRGFEELADELEYTALFITWTLPSRFHRNSPKWDGSSVKEGHAELMRQWSIGRAKLAKLDIEYFGFRVAEPHKDATSHAHYFLFCARKDKASVIRILRGEAINPDREELGIDTSPRFDFKEADPSKGGATAYIAKYVSKNINGKHMPENEAEESAFKVRAWASVHRIRQFQQFGGEPVSLWRSLRKATPEQTQKHDQLEELRLAADSSKWALFCQLAKGAKLAYKENKNDYGEPIKKIIGFEWFGQVIETASECYSLVQTKDVQRLLKSRGATSWSTENNCNSPLIKELRKLTGWSFEGVQCLLKPLANGSTVGIDQYCSIKLQNNTLRLI